MASTAIASGENTDCYSGMREEEITGVPRGGET
jgi:hypothetical protein